MNFRRAVDQRIQALVRKLIEEGYPAGLVFERIEKAADDSRKARDGSSKG